MTCVAKTLKHTNTRTHTRLWTTTFAAGRKTQRVRGVVATLNAAEGLVAQGRLEDAIRGFETVLKHDPGNIDALGWEAAVLPEVGRRGDAQGVLQALLEKAPESPAAHLFLSLRRHRHAQRGTLSAKELLAMWQRAHRAQWQRTRFRVVIDCGRGDGQLDDKAENFRTPWQKLGHKVENLHTL